jgi:osmoprotectant transport system substrate-binding protein
VVASLAASGCRGSDPTTASLPARQADQVVVASFNFPESDLLATAYALALDHAGIPVRRELDLGPRELLLPALRQGLVDVVPEYLGSALSAIEWATGNALGVTEAPVPDRADDVGDESGKLRQELAERLAPWGLRVLEPSPAQDQNGFAVTRATADRLGLRQVSDLAPLAGALTLAGPTECPQRAYCLAGLESVYGLRIGHFVAYGDEQQRRQALLQGVADVAVVFTTDPQLLIGDVVLLADDRHLQPAENVVPVVSQRALDRYGQRLTGALNAVSARFTTTALAFLNWRVMVHRGETEKEAEAWLHREGLLPR